MLITIEPRHWSGRILNPVAWAIREQCEANGELVISGFDLDGIASVYHDMTDVAALYPALSQALGKWMESQGVPDRDFTLDVWMGPRQTGRA